MSRRGKSLSIEDLCPEARTFLATRQGEWRMQFRKCQQMLDELGRFDQLGDAKRSHVKWAGVLSGLLALVSVVWLVTTLEPWTHHLTRTSPWPLAGLVVFVSLTIFCVVRSMKLSKMDLSNDFRRSLEPFLDLISEDVDPKAKVKLNLDLEPGTVDRKRVSRNTEQVAPGTKIIHTLYRDPWCKLELALVDGSEVTFTLVNDLFLSDRYRRNPRGKTKEKKKWKKVTTFGVDLVPNGEQIAWKEEVVKEKAGAAPEAAGGVRIKAGTGGAGDGCRAVRKVKFESTGTMPQETITPRAMMETLAGLFSLTGRVGQEQGKETSHE